MKSLLYKIVSVTMALLLLSSTVSWTVDKHLCLGRVMDIAFFSEAEDCGMTAAMNMMEEDVVEDHCCNDESFTIQGQDDLKTSFNDIDLEQQLFLVAFVSSYVHTLQVQESTTLSSEYYPPPILVKDIQLLDEVFLI